MPQKHKRLEDERKKVAMETESCCDAVIPSMLTHASPMQKEEADAAAIYDSFVDSFKVGAHVNRGTWICVPSCM